MSYTCAVIQILAISFAEAGLLRKNHPATQMHSQRGKTSHIIGEAWENLRSDQNHIDGGFCALWPAQREILLRDNRRERIVGHVSYTWWQRGTILCD